MDIGKFFNGLSSIERILLLSLSVFGLLALMVFFTPEKKSVEVAAPRDPVQIAKSNAKEQCRAAILRSANNKSSVRFQPDAVVQNRGTDIMVIWKLTGKNAYGAESVVLAKCEMTPDGITVLNMTSTDAP